MCASLRITSYARWPLFTLRVASSAIWISDKLHTADRTERYETVARRHREIRSACVNLHVLHCASIRTRGQLHAGHVPRNTNVHGKKYERKSRTKVNYRSLHEYYLRISNAYSYTLTLYTEFLQIAAEESPSANNRFIKFLAELTAFCNHFTNICIHSKHSIYLWIVEEKDLQLAMSSPIAKSSLFFKRTKKNRLFLLFGGLRHLIPRSR